MARRGKQKYRGRHVIRLPGGRSIYWDKYTVMLLALLVVLVAAGARLLGSSAEDRHMQQVNARLQAMHDKAEAQTAENTPVPAPRETPFVTLPPQRLTAQENADSPQAEAPEPSPEPEMAAAAVQAPYQVIQPESGMRAELQGLYDENNDLVGWLEIPDVVDLPVVYRDNNEYYETHDFFGKASVGGTLFLDALHPLEANSQHLVIHGHNMRDGSMFGHLARYQQKDYLQQHPIITWTTLYQQERYDIFAVAIASTSTQDAQYLDYLKTTTFADAEDLQDYLGRLRRVSLYWEDMPVNTDDALLTLSTCLGDDRILVVGKRSGEAGI